MPCCPKHGRTPACLQGKLACEPASCRIGGPDLARTLDLDGVGGPSAADRKDPRSKSGIDQLNRVDGTEFARGEASSGVGSSAAGKFESRSEVGRDPVKRVDGKLSIGHGHIYVALCWGAPEAAQDGRGLARLEGAWNCCHHIPSACFCTPRPPLPLTPCCCEAWAWSPR
eukprot:s3114_g13.t1